jgi:hypothetical protein
MALKLIQNFAHMLERYFITDDFNSLISLTTNVRYKKGKERKGKS